jgi:hypothetical protein
MDSNQRKIDPTALTAKARAAGRKAITARADSRAAQVLPLMVELQAAGKTSLRDIAAALNEKGVPTAWGRSIWTASQVRRVLQRVRKTVG